MNLLESFRKMDERTFGNWGERLWSAVFHCADLHYIPLHAMNGHGAPMLNGKERMILPDFQTVGDRISIYVDSKAKRHPVTCRVAGNELRHGINTRNCEHYGDFASKLRKHSALAIFEAFTNETKREWSGALLLQTLFRLEPHKKPGFGAEAGFKTYWPRHAFKVLGQLTPEQASKMTWSHGEAAPLKDKVREVFELVEADPVQGILW